MIATAVGYDAESGRCFQLQTLTYASEFSASFRAPSQYFVAMLICDGRRTRKEDIVDLSRKLIDAGCAYLCCWGKDCERVHDLFDYELIQNQIYLTESDTNNNDTIMTTWHDDDSLDDFIEFAIEHARPTNKYQQHCNSVVAIVIDDAKVSLQIQKSFRDLGLGPKPEDLR